MQTDIAVHLPNLNGGGAERIAVRLSNELSARGYNIDIVLSRATGPFINDVSEDVSLIDLDSPEMPIYGALGSLPALGRYLRDKEPTSLLTFLTRVNVVALLTSRIVENETKLVVSERNHLSSSLDQYGQVGKVVLPKLVRRSYPWADEIISISAGVAQDLSKITKIPVSDMRVIHNPAYEPEIKNESQEPMTHPWFGPGKPPVVLAVGSLTAQKDFATLIKAFASYVSNNAGRLLILGEGRQREKLESLAAEYQVENNVEFPGFVDNPYKYMSNASVFVLSSRWEGFGNVIVEAMACGTPIVSTDCPSGPAEILEHGKHGRLVPPGDPEALAEAIEATLAEPPASEQLIERAKAFSVEDVADQYLDGLLP